MEASEEEADDTVNTKWSKDEGWIRKTPTLWDEEEEDMIEAQEDIEPDESLEEDEPESTPVHYPSPTPPTVTERHGMKRVHSFSFISHIPPKKPNTILGPTVKEEVGVSKFTNPFLPLLPHTTPTTIPERPWSLLITCYVECTGPYVGKNSLLCITMIGSFYTREYSETVVPPTLIEHTKHFMEYVQEEEIHKTEGGSRWDKQELRGYLNNVDAGKRLRVIMDVLSRSALDMSSICVKIETFMSKIELQYGKYDLARVLMAPGSFSPAWLNVIVPKSHSGYPTDKFTPEDTTGRSVLDILSRGKQFCSQSIVDINGYGLDWLRARPFQKRRYHGRLGSEGSHSNHNIIFNHIEIDPKDTVERAAHKFMTQNPRIFRSRVTQPPIVITPCNIEDTSGPPPLEEHTV